MATSLLVRRLVIVSKAASLLHYKAAEFARIMTLEPCLRISEGRKEEELSSQILKYYATDAKRFHAPVAFHSTFSAAHTGSSPLGLIFSVEPWNFPN